MEMEGLSIRASCVPTASSYFMTMYLLDDAAAAARFMDGQMLLFHGRLMRCGTAVRWRDDSSDIITAADDFHVSSAARTSVCAVRGAR